MSERLVIDYGAAGEVYARVWDAIYERFSYSADKAHEACMAAVNAYLSRLGDPKGESD
jgi:hypothetical protein